MKTKDRIGRCKLTGDLGRFVDSHIIPEALTETVWNGQPLTQRPANASTAKDRTSAESRISAGLASVRRRHRRMAILLAAGR